MFIDVHNHIDYYPESEIPAIVERARKAGVGVILNNATTVETIGQSLEMVEKYAIVKAALGIFPTHCEEMGDKEFEMVLKIIERNKGKILAIGEVGLDLKEGKNIELQIKRFEKFIELSMKLDKPIIVHSRKAEEKAIEVLERMNAKKVIMHCFSGNFKLIKRIRDNGWWFTIPTNVGYSEHFQKMVEEIEIEKLFCETDSPFMHPLKEKFNEPCFVVESYKKIAEIKGLSLKEVEKKIEENYKFLF